MMESREVGGIRKQMPRWVTWLVPFALVACSVIDPAEERPTEITLTVDETTKAAAEEFTFTYAAQGTALHRVVIDFGDGSLQADSTFFSTASATMDGFMRHAYDSTGTYVVIGWVEDLAVGADTTELAVVVN